VKWYDFTRWLLERIDSFPKNQRFVFGTRLADHALDVLETLVEASYNRRKVELLARVNRKTEMLRWLVRLAKEMVDSHHDSVEQCWQRNQTPKEGVHPAPSAAPSFWLKGSSAYKAKFNKSRRAGEF
jgi:hypothetical protein